MIIPTSPPRIGRRQALPNNPPDQTETTITPATTTVDATGTGGLLSSAASGTNLQWWQLLCIALGGAIALCILVWVYWRHKRKRKTDKKRKKEAEKEQDVKVKEELERQQREEEDAKKGKSKKGKGKANGRGRGSDSESWSSSEESYDSVSDGGTIRPRRRRKMGRGRGRRRRRSGRGRRDWSSDSETESDTDDSEYSYMPRNRRRRGRRRGRYGEGDSDDEINDFYDRRGGRRRRGGRYEPETPTPPVPPLPAKARNKREAFRDSVFSSYSSMKKAAVRLKYVEQKVKLKKQLEAEEAVEQVRRDKVVQANKDIKRQKEEEERARMIEEIRAEKKMRRVEREMEEANREVEEANRRLDQGRRPMSRVQSSGDSGQPLIPAARTYTLSSSGGSSASTSQFRSPPARRRPSGQSTYNRGQPQIPPAAKLSHSRTKGDTIFDAGALDTALPAKKPMARPPARKQSTFAPTAVLPYATPHPPPPARKGSGLGTEINHLLGTREPPGRALYPKAGGAEPVPQRSLEQMKHSFARPPLPPEPNDFQASWLSRPDPALSVPQTARTDSVYVPVTRPKDRPIIPPGGLAPAPQGKKKPSSTQDGTRDGSVAVPSAGSVNKWADRLRAKR